MNKNLFFSILIFLPLVTLSQKRTLLIGGTAYVGNGDKIENSVICIEGEKIDFVANSYEIKIDPHLIQSSDYMVNLYIHHLFYQTLGLGLLRLMLFVQLMTLEKLVHSTLTSELKLHITLILKL